MNILFISYLVPYDAVRHAGGKTLNYYYKKCLEEKKVSSQMLSLASPQELSLLRKDEFGNNTIIFFHESWKESLFDYAISMWTRMNVFHWTGNMLPYCYIRKILKKLPIIKKEFCPDVIELDWTQMGLLIGKVKRIFPNSRYVIIEHDVSYLGYKRKYEVAKGPLNRLLCKIRYNNLKKRELRALSKADIVLVNNMKDYNLLVEDGICKDKIKIQAPYYDRYEVQRVPRKGKMVFFGAMNRMENYDSVIWFIENVLNNMDEESLEYCVIGGNPPEKLKQYESKRVKVLGFVEDIREELKDAMIAVLPLTLGAGIKVKVLELGYAGVPIITNHIGIEGIPLIPREDYIHCETPEEYIEAIRRVMKGEFDLEKMAANAKRKISETFDLEISYRDYFSTLEELST